MRKFNLVLNQFYYQVQIGQGFDWLVYFVNLFVFCKKKNYFYLVMRKKQYNE